MDQALDRHHPDGKGSRREAYDLRFGVSRRERGNRRHPLRESQAGAEQEEVRRVQYRITGLLLLGILLAFGSGVAALIYEVVWFQVLELVIGSTAVSLGILLATFMGGMCLGSWLFPRVFSDQPPSPARVRAHRARNRNFRACGVASDSARGQRIHGLERIRREGISAPRTGRDCLPACPQLC